MHRSARTSIFALAALVVSACSGGHTGSSLPITSGGGAAMVRHAAVWIPAAQSTFAIQYDGKLDLSVDADTYDLDGFDTKADTVSQLHQNNRHVVCY
ncbi:MAG: endo alpha-1,4 polygalactosaminidase, partial [Candidatus Tumulicola sp.]